MLKRIKILIILFLTMTAILLGQNVQDSETVFPKGITIDYGMDSYSVRDEIISKEKYSGAFPYFAAT